MVRMNRKSDFFWGLLCILGLYTGFLVYTILIYGPDSLTIGLSIFLILLLAFYLVQSSKTFLLSKDGITVITLNRFQKTYPWQQAPRIFTCTLKEKPCRYRKYFVLPLRFQEDTLPPSMLRSGWYFTHADQAALYPYSYRLEQEILRECPYVELVRLYSRYEDL